MLEDGPMTFSTLLKRPSGYLPLGMSVAALGLVLGHLAMYGAGRQPDEGTAAHLFQLLMVAQAPLVALFAIRWVPQSPRTGVQVLALQIAAAVIAVLSVRLIEH